MDINEESKCTISRKSGDLSFVMRLLRIENSGHYFSQSPKQMLELATKYKENGVKMFSKYPLFAHQYFSRAAKCILSFAPLHELDPAKEGADTIGGLQTLLETLYLNIAACLIKQNRYEEVLQTLEYVDRQEKPSEKAVYRRALAQFHVKQFAEAIQTLERIDYSANKECVALHRKIMESRSQEDKKYNDVMRKMFS